MRECRHFNDNRSPSQIFSQPGFKPATRDRSLVALISIERVHANTIQKIYPYIHRQRQHLLVPRSLPACAMAMSASEESVGKDIWVWAATLKNGGGAS